MSNAAAPSRFSRRLRQQPAEQPGSLEVNQQQPAADQQQPLHDQVPLPPPPARGRRGNASRPARPAIQRRRQDAPPPGSGGPLEQPVPPPVLQDQQQQPVAQPPLADPPSPQPDRVVDSDPRLEAEPDFSSPAVRAAIHVPPGETLESRIAALRDAFRRDLAECTRIWNEQVWAQEHFNQASPSPERRAVSFAAPAPYEEDEDEEDFPFAEDDAVVGRVPELRPTPFANTKNQQCEYVQMAYFLPFYCQAVFRDTPTAATDTLSLTQTSQGLAFCPLHNSRAIPGIPQDVNLAWADVMIASGPYIESLRRARFPQRLLKQLREFFDGLQRHRAFLMWDNGERVVLEYQFRVRKL